MNALSMFQNSNGKFSSVRIAFLFTVFVVVITWAIVSYKKETFQAPEQIVILVLGLGGVKAFQGYTDKKLLGKLLTDSQSHGKVKP